MELYLPVLHSSVLRLYLSPLPKENFIPKIRTEQIIRLASLIAGWKISLEKKQDGKLLRADFCLTPVWHPGALAPYKCVHPVSWNTRLIVIEPFASQIYCLLFLINGSNWNMTQTISVTNLSPSLIRIPHFYDHGK